MFEFELETMLANWALPAWSGHVANSNFYVRTDFEGCCFASRTSFPAVSLDYKLRINNVLDIKL